MADGGRSAFVIRPIDARPSEGELALAGRVYADSAPALREALDGATATGLRTLVVDATRLEQIDALALRAFVDLLKQLRPHAGQIVFFGLSPLIARMFSIVGLDRVVQLVSTREEALRAAEVTV